HCIGMCGAIALSLPVQQFAGWKKYSGILLYNIGRVITYGAMGAVLGTLGSTFNFMGWQQALSVILGVLLFIICILAIKRNTIRQSAFVQKHWNNKLINIIASLFQN